MYAKVYVADDFGAIVGVKVNSAVALYGENAKEGVVRIKLKAEAQQLYVIYG